MWFTICFNYLIKRFDNLIIYNFLIISDFLYLIIKLNIRKLFLNIFSSFSIFQITNIVINWKAQNNKDKLKKVVFIGCYMRNIWFLEIHIIEIRVLLDNEKNIICFMIIYCLYLYFQNYPLGDLVNNHHSCPCHPENTGRKKKKKQFWFSFGGFTRIFSEIKQGWISP